MTPSHESEPAAPDFFVVDFLQRVEAFRHVAQSAGADVRAAVRAAELYGAAVLVPVCGSAVQLHGTIGFDPDGFMLRRGSFRFRTIVAVESMTLQAWIPQQHGGEVEIRMRCGQHEAKTVALPGTMASLLLPVTLAQAAEGDVLIELSASFQPSQLEPGNPDTRHLGCIVQSVSFG